MRADADFMVYVGARWPSLLREAVLLGCPPELAAEAATDALARCRRGWERASREEDVDQLVRGELATACARRPTGAASDEDRREQAERLVVLAPPSLDELRAQEREVQVRIAKRAAVVLVPVLLLVAGLTWWTTRDDGAEQPSPELQAAAVTRAENPAAGVTWWANGELHLDHVVLAVAGLRDMTRLGSGAVVYGDDKGRVVYIVDDGARTVLGHKDSDVPVAATAENGWAAWVDPTGEEPRLRVHDAATGHQLASLTTDASARVIAVDGDVVYFVDAEGSHALIPRGTMIPVGPDGLFDVRSRIRGFQISPATIQVVQSYFNVEFTLPGRGVGLSPDGNLVVTRLGEGDDSDLAVYDTRSGAELLNGLADTDVALAVAPGPRETIAYVVSQGGLESGRDLQLRTCDLRTSLCRIVARIPDDGSTPVLAR